MALKSASAIFEEDAADLFAEFGTDANGEPIGLLRPVGAVDSVAVHAIVDYQLIAVDDDSQAVERRPLIGLLKSELPSAGVEPGASVAIDQIRYRLAELLDDDGIAQSWVARRVD